ncbi:MAG: ParA family protein [Eubacteriaceae bacterium]|nr:ParA family protein [Eubacteriaceae bacterium]
MGVVIALFNQKGGVGKTTTCANLCAGLALHNKKVLCVDFDPQSNLSGGLGVDRRSLEKTVYDVLLGNEKAEDCIIKGNIEGLDILPASIDLAGAEIEISNVEKRETVLKRALAGIIDKYDYIIIDCPPSLGLLPVNALAVCSHVLIPIQCEYYALEGVSQLINTVNLVKRSLNPKLDVVGVLLTMFDSRTNLSHQVAGEVKHFFGSKVFNTIIPRNVRLAEAPSHGMTIFEYDKQSKGAEAYYNVAGELIKRMEVENG